MSRKEVPRAGLVRASLAGKITSAEGADALNISERQFRRLKTRYRMGGGAALLHRSRGRPSGRALDPATRERVVALMKSTYAGLNDCHLTEKLREQEGLSISRDTVRRIRRALALPAKRPRRPRQHRARRLREAREGALVQIDGSPFEWLEDRGPAMTLVGAVDDARGKVLAASFRPHEDLHGYATVFQHVFTHFGLPVAFYGDGTNILVRNDDHWTLEEELEGEQHPTHLGRVLQELGVRYIRARSPQAKGRIENRWSTLQDRLVSELRLRGVSTMEAANAFLPEFLDDFNRRFARDPRDAAPAWRRPPREIDLILACRYARVVAADNTVTLPGHRKSERDTAPCGHDHRPGRPAALPRMLQIPPGPFRRSYAGCRVEIRELLDGRLVALYRDRIVASQLWPSGEFALSPRGAARLGCKSSTAAAKRQAKIVARPARHEKRDTLRNRRKPAPTHPWRRTSPLNPYTTATS